MHSPEAEILPPPSPMAAISAAKDGVSEAALAFDLALARIPNPFLRQEVEAAGIALFDAMAALAGVSMEIVNAKLAMIERNLSGETLQ